MLHTLPVAMLSFGSTPDVAQAVEGLG
jgi:hypothetical protein